jgi:putative ATP-binding cassette transporter
MVLIRFLFERAPLRVTLGVITCVLAGGLNVAAIGLLGHALSRGVFDVFDPLFVLLVVIGPLMRVCSENLLVQLVETAAAQLRSDLSEAVLDLPLRKFEELGAHRLLSVFTGDVPRIVRAVTLLPMMTTGLIISTGCVAYMFNLSRVVFLAVVLFMIIGVGLYSVALRFARQYLEKSRNEDDALHRNLEALFSGIKELKINNPRRRAFFREKFLPTVENARKYATSGLRIYSFGNAVAQLLLFVTIGVTIHLFSRIGAGAHTQTAFCLALLYLVGPVQALTNALPELSRAGVAVQSLQSLNLTLRSSVERNSGQIPFCAAFPDQTPLIEAIAIKYSYARDGYSESDRFVLGPLNLKIFPGELVFLTGGNGSGKTTLAKLLTGLYTPISGRLLWQGREINDSNRSAYRENFAVVFSEPFVFESLLDLDDSIDQEARVLLKRFGLDHAVSVRRKAFSTVALSHGQRKRLALVNALLDDRPVYFLDELAADQDPAFRRRFYYEVLPRLRAAGKTIIVISHDERFFDVADRILTLDEGWIGRDIPGDLHKANITINPLVNRVEDYSKVVSSTGTSNPI